MISLNINNKTSKKCKKCKHCYEFDRYGGDMPSTLHCTNTESCIDLNNFTLGGKFPKQTTVYLHSGKEEMIGIGKKLGLSEEAVEKFMYCCYEVEVEIEVNADGTYKILKVS